MSTVSRYEPWNLLDRLHRDLSSAMKSSPNNLDDTDSNVVTSNWLPAVDIREDAGNFVLAADLPGIDPKDVEITMENKVLTIKGERQYQRSDEKEAFRRVERAYGTFYRRFSLPDTADGEAIRAEGKDGVLTITIPKREAAQPRRIEVQV